MPKFAKNEFATVFLWKIVNDKEKIENYSYCNMRNLIQVLFPGIKLLYEHMYDVLIFYCIPSIEKQFSDLKNISQEDAEKQYGKIIKVVEERKCSGYEWVDWDIT